MKRGLNISTFSNIQKAVSEEEQKKEVKTENARISEEFIKLDDEIVKWFKEYNKKGKENG